MNISPTVRHLFVSALTLWFASCSKPENKPASFLDVIVALDRAEPIDTEVIKRLVSQTVKCRGYGVSLDCEEHGATVGDAENVTIDFRSTPSSKWSILERDDMSLIRIARRR